MTTSGMTGAEFRDLALSLRESGAVKVRCGELEVVWAPAALSPRVPSPVSPPQKRDEEPPPRSAEEARLRDYRRELEGGD